MEGLNRTQTQVVGILSKLSEVAERNDRSFDRLALELEKLKEAKYRPYLTSMGTFLILIFGVTSYIYSLEVRLTRVIFDLSSSIHQIEGETKVNNERIQVMSERFKARTQGMETRWTAHNKNHSSMSDMMITLSDRIFIITGEKKDSGGKQER